MSDENELKKGDKSEVLTELLVQTIHNVAAKMGYKAGRKDGFMLATFVFLGLACVMWAWAKFA